MINSKWVRFSFLASQAYLLPGECRLHVNNFLDVTEKRLSQVGALLGNFSLEAEAWSIERARLEYLEK